MTRTQNDSAAGYGGREATGMHPDSTPPTNVKPEAIDLGELCEKLRAVTPVYNRGPNYEPLMVEPGPLRLQAADAIERLSQSLRDMEAENQRLVGAHVEACDAADVLLARITAEIGRYIIEATDEDMVPLMNDSGVVLTGKMIRRLYEATDRAALPPGPGRGG